MVKDSEKCDSVTMDRTTQLCTETGDASIALPKHGASGLMSIDHETVHRERVVYHHDARTSDVGSLAVSNILAVSKL